VSRNLDAAIAEALEYQIYHENYQKDLWHYFKPEPDGEYIGALPHYSTDGNAMLELDREMRGRGWRIELWYADAENVYVAHYEKPGSDFIAEGKAETEPLARALAACYALTGKEWTE
jgi:hypothetical protein